jgi:hypothetical protein
MQAIEHLVLDSLSEYQLANTNYGYMVRDILSGNLLAIEYLADRPVIYWQHYVGIELFYLLVTWISSHEFFYLLLQVLHFMLLRYVCMIQYHKIGLAR